MPISVLTSAQLPPPLYNSEPAKDTLELVQQLRMPQVRKVGLKPVRNWSISQFSSSGAVQEMVTDAANDIESITLFQDPLPDPQRSQVILESA